MKKFWKEFVLRGLTCAAGGPVVLAIIYGILGATGAVEALSQYGQPDRRGFRREPDLRRGGAAADDLGPGQRTVGHRGAVQQKSVF